MKNRAIYVSLAAAALASALAVGISYRVGHTPWHAAAEAVPAEAAREGQKKPISQANSPRNVSAKVAAPPSSPAEPSQAEKAYGERVAARPVFKTFADTARLDDNKRLEVARIVQLYEDNDDSLELTMELDSKPLKAMRQQLLLDTAGQLRRRLTESAWSDLVRADIVPGIAQVLPVAAVADRGRSE